MGDAEADEQSRGVTPIRRWRPHWRWVVVAGGAIVLVTALAAQITFLRTAVPHPVGAAQLRGAIPRDEEFANINRVSQWPADWIAAVCEPPLYPLRRYTRLPNATSTASCRSKVKPAGDVHYLMVARFPSELPMQVDLHNEGYEWYAFAFDHAGLIVIATVGDEVVTGPNGLGISPVLEPLLAFGFNIYRNPGPP